MLLIASLGTRISHNSISSNGLTADQAGLIVFDSSEIRIARNSVTDNGDIGMFIIGVDDSRVARNLVSGNPEAGVVLDGNGNVFRRNRVMKNGDNVVLVGNGNKLIRNKVADALGFPDDPIGGFGILIEGGDHNWLQHNVITDAASNGFRVVAFDPAGTGLSRGNVLRGNRVKSTGLDGVLIDQTAINSQLVSNVAIGAGDDGIDVDSRATTLTRNTANRNRDLGIEAVPGVVDGGGNRANGNGNPLQCRNVVCS